ncbi:hypothetical protein J8L98_24270 [Pseudoalteromonas sp. MMG013]|uniref:Uncharacterized protein n=1 Tax=Pseudoalteromonas aurantia 208 TaxID=1314867 RepID=A0ABR9EC52_9GAMM|nr:MULTISPECIES: hypothetical protein [Pseudoalteromonas]MBE0368563.1 hypothetical protein [Pseudoalteromonas aurantia 208]MBQ4848254.1 hypothetical protein [Pseudoalteromonas sp. MMG005]MBQ4864804.1 hypothetical protein [Pseudoalteromonas sp. MMG013]
MKLKLNKKKVKNLSRDIKAIANDMTPQVAAGAGNWFTQERDFCEAPTVSCRRCYNDTSGCTKGQP